MDLGLSGQVAVVTGGGQGIGAEIAMAFGEEGCEVAVWDRDMQTAEAVAERIRKADGKAFAVAADVTRRESVDTAVSRTLEQGKGIQVLVNNAGFSLDAPFLEMTQERWSSVLDVCLTGVFHCSQSVAAHMVSARYGRIVNISSRSHMGDFSKVNYVAAKAGVTGLTKALALELAPHQITVNAIAPGFIRTERVLKSPFYAQMDERAKQRTPIQRAGTPRDVANTALFLAAKSSGFITADVIHVSGGRFASM